MSTTMMHQPLTIGSVIDHAARYHARTEVVSVETEGGLTRSDWGQISEGSHRLASALGKLGVEHGERCATIAWNNREGPMSIIVIPPTVCMGPSMKLCSEEHVHYSGPEIPHR